MSKYEPTTGWCVMLYGEKYNFLWGTELFYTRVDAIYAYCRAYRAPADVYYGLKKHHKSAKAMWRSEQRAGLVKCIKVELKPMEATNGTDDDN